MPPVVKPSDGSITVIVDRFQGKRLNSPNDIAPHKDGSLWFTDPLYGAQLQEGHHAIVERMRTNLTFRGAL